MQIGANHLKEKRCEFIVWAPSLNEVSLELVYPKKRSIPMKKNDQGYWKVLVDDVLAGTGYFYKLNNAQSRPDPASFFQPEGVHGPSQVIDHTSFKWSDQAWKGLPIEKMVIYELHTGTFTREGTFEAIISRLNDLLALGINAIEIMPVAQFPGERNWGYDGTFLFSVQNSYGGPEGLKKLINACHSQGIAVILDVVYNHLGPEGNYLSEFGPYFTNKYNTLWGSAVNFDDKDNQGVRNFFIENALYWLINYYIDALRLDAIHGIFDASPKHILQELSEKVKEFSKQQERTYYLIAESDLNDSRVVRERKFGGFGVDAQWCDDFHHSLHTLLTGEKTGYYADFGKIKDLEKSFKEGFVYSGQFSQFRNRPHGNSSSGISAYRFVVFAQNHDQVGNRMFGERLSALVDFEALKLAAAVALVSPYIPLLFMGEEYGEDAPFLYFVSHSDENLINAVRQGRKKEFASFGWEKEPPDPQSKDTFLAAKLNWEKRKESKSKVLWEFYHQLIRLRRENLVLSNRDNRELEIISKEKEKVILLRRWLSVNEIFCIMNFNKEEVFISNSIPQGRWRKVIDSTESKWAGPGSKLPPFIEQKGEFDLSPSAFVLYSKEI